MRLIVFTLLITGAMASIGHADSAISLEDAITTYGRAEFEQSINALEPWAERGNPVAQLLLGKTLMLTFVREHDCTRATHWLKNSAEAGNSEAAFELGRIFQEGQCAAKDPIAALRWYAMAHSLGHGDAANAVGELLLIDPHVADQATEWFLKSTANMDWHGAYNLGKMYQSGRGLRRNQLEAFKWLHLAYLISPIYPTERNMILERRDAARESLTPLQVDLESREAEQILTNIIEPPTWVRSPMQILHATLKSDPAGVDN